MEIIIKNIKDKGEILKEGDIIVISEKVIATSQGRIINLNEISIVSEEAKGMAKEFDMDERFVEIILQEASVILGGLPGGHVILAKINDLLIANAGIDQSNAGPENVVLLPKDLEKVVWEYRNVLKKEFNITNLGVIFADSRVQPLRKGTIGIAIATAGFEPIEDLRGHPDLYNRPLQITMRAIADDLTSAAQFLLNEGDQQTPVVIIRGANVK
ncbi:MAG: coenzyme F420-0:L-glutamate ligase, partial [Promethearchaeota archaeon]